VAAKGTAWLVWRSRDLVSALAALALALREWVEGRQGPSWPRARRRGAGRHPAGTLEPEGLKQVFRKPAAYQRVTFGSSQGAEPILNS